MTIRERSKLRKAIKCLMTDDGWDEGMAIIVKLAYPEWQNPLDGAKTITLYELLAQASPSREPSPALSPDATTNPQSVPTNPKTSISEPVK